MTPRPRWGLSRDMKYSCFSAQGHPDDVGAVGLDHAGDSGVVEVLDPAEGQFDELHAGDIGIDGGEVFLQSVQNVLSGTEEDHAVAPAPDNISENLAAAVLAVLPTINPILYTMAHNYCHK